jgi:hypothetical protein
MQSHTLCMWTSIRVIHQELRTICVGGITQADIRCIRELYNARRLVLPVRPTSVQLVREVLNKLKKLRHHTTKTLFNSTTKMQIFLFFFVCQQSWKFHFIDNSYRRGNNSSLPQIFRLLFTIHGLKNEHYIHLAYFCYKKIHFYISKFRSMINECTNLSETNVCPQKFFADFETAVHQAVE